MKTEKIPSASIITREPFPNSEKIYVSGKLFPFIKVPMRKIKLSPTKLSNGQIQENPDVVVYDTSGPYT
ncbi:MAG: phosphomethylpyrimidine synthase ThiC, partial [Bacteroidia bacterium]|nr:phosphomethylpyrimidine synthase ThiC [Bacteroidia bacterium]